METHPNQRDFQIWGAGVTAELPADLHDPAHVQVFLAIAVQPIGTHLGVKTAARTGWIPARLQCR